MARARQATRHRSAFSGRSRSSAGFGFPGPQLGEAIAGLIRPEAIGIALILIAAVAVPWLSPFTDILPSFGGLVERMGLGAFGLGVALVVWGWLIYRRAVPRQWSFWRRWLGVLALALFVLGVLSWFRMDWSLGGVSLSDTTAGGSIGRWFFDSLPAALLWLALGIAGAWLVSPSATVSVLQRWPAVWHAVVAMRIPHHLWVALRATVRGGRWLFRSSADEEDDLDEVTVRSPFGPGYIDDSTTPSVDLEAGLGQRPFDRIAALRDEPGAQGRMPFDDAAPLGTLTLPARPDIEAATAVATTGRLATGRWRLPPVDLMKASGVRDQADIDNVRRAQLIVETLASFGVDARVAEISEGPTVTQFGVEPGWEVKTRTVQERDKEGRPALDKDGRPKMRTEEVSRTRVRVNQITSLANDLALALAAPSLRIEAPVPGKPIVGIEVPNHDATVVNLRSVIESTAFQRMANRSKLGVALGQGVSGEAVVADLAKMPHLLIAGATGSGKSVCLNSIIACLLMHCAPDDLRMVMVDPKRVELAAFADTPHLAFSRIIVDVEEVPGALQAVLSEMDARYRKFAQLAVRNIESYNRHPKVLERMPYWVVIIDELADLMMASPYEVERQICRLAQLARATGIHLIVATQRPSVDVVTGLIKANFPTRIAFAVSSQVDSRTILDQTGAEKLLGRGDMLFMATDAAQPKRLQGVFVSDQEIDAVVNFWRREGVEHKPPTFDYLLEEARERAAQDAADEARDPLFERARDLALEHTRISTSMLQRRMRIGYPRAARLMDELEAEGVVGSAEGGNSREVLVSAGEIEDDPAWS